MVADSMLLGEAPEARLNGRTLVGPWVCDALEGAYLVSIAMFL